MIIYVIMESAPYDSGDRYSDPLEAFLVEDDAIAAIRRMEQNPNKHKYGEPIYFYEEIKLSFPAVDVEALARRTYSRLCPHAPKDLPIEKSTTMTAFIEGFKLGRER